MSICYYSCKTQNFTGILQKALLKNFAKLSGNQMFRSCRPAACSFVEKETLVHRFSMGSLEKFVEQVSCTTPSLTASKSKFNTYRIDIPYPEILSCFLHQEQVYSFGPSLVFRFFSCYSFHPFKISELSDLI